MNYKSTDNISDDVEWKVVNLQRKSVGKEWASLKATLVDTTYFTQ